MISLRSQRGASLLGALATISFVSMIAVMVNSALTERGQQQAGLTGDAERRAIGAYVLSVTDCDESIINSGCKTATAPVPVTLYRRRLGAAAPEVVIMNDGTSNRRGPFLLKALCDPATLEISVLAVRAPSDATFSSTAAKDFLPNPATGKVITWASPEANVLVDKGPVCRTIHRPYPWRVICRSWPTDPAHPTVPQAPVTEVSFEILELTDAVSASPIDKSAVKFMGPTYGDVDYVYYSQASPGGRTGYNDGALKAFNASGQAVVGGNTMECPAALALDGRQTQR